MLSNVSWSYKDGMESDKKIGQWRKPMRGEGVMQEKGRGNPARLGFKGG